MTMTQKTTPAHRITPAQSAKPYRSRWLPTRHEQLDFQHSCIKCGATPVKNIARGRYEKERQCPHSGYIQFLQALKIAL